MPYKYPDIEALAQVLVNLESRQVLDHILLKVTSGKIHRLYQLPERLYPEFISAVTSRLDAQSEGADVPEVRRVGRHVIIAYNGQHLTIPADKANQIGNRLNLLPM